VQLLLEGNPVAGSARVPRLDARQRRPDEGPMEDELYALTLGLVHELADDTAASGVELW
jgi:hypothetical protein